VDLKLVGFAPLPLGYLTLMQLMKTWLIGRFGLNRPDG
jgi:hypothetical protein